MSNTVPEDESLQALLFLLPLTKQRRRRGRRGVCPLPAINFISGYPWVQKRLESFGSLSAFLYRSEPNRSLTLCSGETFRHTRTQGLRKNFLKKWKKHSAKLRMEVRCHIRSSSEYGSISSQDQQRNVPMSGISMGRKIQRTVTPKLGEKSSA